MPRGEVRPFTTDEEEDLARQREAVKKYEEEAAEEYERHRLRARVTQRQEDLGRMYKSARRNIFQADDF